MDYYNIEKILTTEEVVPITFKSAVLDFGYLDPYNDDDVKDLPHGTKLALPLWLSEPLASVRALKVELPRSFGKAFRQDLRADPTVVSMKGYPFFYEVGLRIARLVADRDLRTVIKNSFARRFIMVLDNAQNFRGRDSSTITVNLTDSERKLFDKGYKSSIEFDKWRHRRHSELTASQIVEDIRQTRRKRKRAEMEGTDNVFGI